jgi:hypothetical protein
MLCDADGNDPDQPSWMVYREMAIMTCRMQNASKAFADQHSEEFIAGLPESEPLVINRIKTKVDNHLGLSNDAA